MSELVSRAKNFWKTGAPEFGFHVSQCRDLHRCKHHTEQLALQIMTVKHARGLRSCPHIRFVFFAESLTCPMATRSELTVMRLCFFHLVARLVGMISILISSREINCVRSGGVANVDVQTLMHFASCSRVVVCFLCFEASRINM